MSTERQSREIVLQVACCTEDRSATEQRAMLDEAIRLDSARAKWTVTNHDPRPPMYVDLVRATYDPSEDDRVDLTAKEQEAHERRLARYYEDGP